jgi:hypothetical protein
MRAVRRAKVPGAGAGATRLPEALWQTASRLGAPGPAGGMGEGFMGARVWGARAGVMGTAVHGPGIRSL